jgi:hypothetical protein
MKQLALFTFPQPSTRTGAGVQPAPAGEPAPSGGRSPVELRWGADCWIEALEWLSDNDQAFAALEDELCDLETEGLRHKQAARVREIETAIDAMAQAWIEGRRRETIETTTGSVNPDNPQGAQP